MKPPAPTTAAADSPQAEQLRQVSLGSTVTVRELADKLEVKVTQLMGELIKQGIMAAVNERIDFATAAAVAVKFDVKVVAPQRAGSTSSATAKPAGQPRPPVVAVMGHVDHGKTSLLDKIRNTKVAAAEAGGITQHIRAHQVEYQGRLITFLDTPGHQAFSMLREHGAHLTDIALIVVAADDGIKPQTKEAIEFATKAGVKIIVAITKVDKPGLELNQLKQQLNDQGLVPEDWGGDTIIVETSVVKDTGINKLLEMVLLIAEVEQLSALADGPASGTVIETNLATGQGTRATLLIESGRLQMGDHLLAGQAEGKVRRLEDMNQRVLTSAAPSTPVVVSGWKMLPELGQRFQAATTAGALNRGKQAAATVDTQSSLNTTPDHVAVDGQNRHQLLAVIKADSHGSLEALTTSLEQLTNQAAAIKIISQGLGPITESDITLAGSVGAQIIGFNVPLPVAVKQQADRQDIQVRLYRVIYELIDELKNELDGLIEPEIVELKVAELELKGIFKITKNNLICGGLVTEGKISRDLIVKQSKGSETTTLGKLVNVQKDQQDTKEVVSGQMTGLNIATEQKAAVEIGQTLEFFQLSSK